MLIAGKMKNQYVQNEPAAYETQKTAMSSLRCLKKKNDVHLESCTQISCFQEH